MILDCGNSEGLSRLIQRGDWEKISQIEFTGATLGGVIELARFAFLANEATQLPVTKLLGKVPECFRAFENALQLLTQPCPPRRNLNWIYSAPSWELWQVRGPESAKGKDFELFLQRFERGLKAAGFSDRFPRLLAQGLLELSENIVRHSVSGNDQAIGLAGFHVTPGMMSYVVADVGRGVLSSLKENPEWADLEDEMDALVAVAKKDATRLRNRDFGDGYRQVFQSFLDRDGLLQMRSGNGVARVQGNLTERNAQTSHCAPILGLRVVASCALKGKPREAEFSC